MSQEQRKRPEVEQAPEEHEAKNLHNEELAESTDEVLDRIDEMLDDGLLDEIDSVLEENAAEFIRGFVQKGGE